MDSRTKRDLMILILFSVALILTAVNFRVLLDGFRS